MKSNPRKGEPPPKIDVRSWADEESVDEKKVEVITGIPRPTLRNDRSLGKGIPYYKLSPHRQGAVRYRLSDIAKYMEARRVEPSR